MQAGYTVAGNATGDHCVPDPLVAIQKGDRCECPCGHLIYRDTAAGPETKCERCGALVVLEDLKSHKLKLILDTYQRTLDAILAI